MDGVDEEERLGSGRGVAAQTLSPFLRGVIPRAVPTGLSLCSRGRGDTIGLFLSTYPLGMKDLKRKLNEKYAAIKYRKIIVHPLYSWRAGE
jgi:hypothetical protein